KSVGDRNDSRRGQKSRCAARFRLHRGRRTCWNCHCNHGLSLCRAKRANPKLVDCEQSILRRRKRRSARPVTVYCSLCPALPRRPRCASQSAVKRRKDSINLDRRTLAILRAALSCALRSKHRDAQVPDFIVDLAKGGFGKFVRRCEGFLEANHAGERAIDLIAGQTAED